MLPVSRSLLVIVVWVSSSLVLFSQATGSEVPRAETVYTKDAVEWPTPLPDGGLLLTVAGPQDLYVRQEYPAGHWPRFSLNTEQGQPRADGVYKWELVVQSGWEGVVESGWFEIRAGRPVAEGTGEPQPVMIETDAPAPSLYVDSRGRLGLGTTVPQSQLHLKGSSPALTLEDTTTGGRLFTLRGLERGDGSLGLFDQTTGEARWLVDNKGRMGINTTTPTSTFTVDGYIEATKGFLVNGRPLGGIGFGLIGGSQPLYVEDPGKAIFGNGAGAVNTAINVAFFGSNAGNANTTGTFNAFFGQAAGWSNNTGNNNSFFGMQAGNQNTTASDNSAFGYRAGYLNSTGANNAFFGSEAGYNTTGFANAFFGRSAGRSNTAGAYNSFFGYDAGYSNTIANGNAFFGHQAGRASTGGVNSFFGASAGLANTTGSQNNFFGTGSGNQNTTGSDNAFFGHGAGVSNTVESGNTFIGVSSNGAAGIANATALGYKAIVTQANSLVLGSIAGLNNAQSYVNVGIGTSAPARQLHLAGPNAVFRMDRTTDTASFILVRTDPTGATPWKTFVVGTNATGVNQGEFIINDIGAAVGGGGNRRMTITNDGSVIFTGQVYAAGFTPTSSRAFKTNIRAFENALETVSRLRGVRFDWKESGKPAVGLIAEEVDEVVPEVVAHEGGAAKGVNYANLVAVLVEAVKEQQKTIEKLERQQDELTGLKAEVERLKLLLQER